jgi:hypothetical protein
VFVARHARDIGVFLRRVSWVRKDLGPTRDYALIEATRAERVSDGEKLIFFLPKEKKSPFEAWSRRGRARKWSTQRDAHCCMASLDVSCDDK